MAYTGLNIFGIWWGFVIGLTVCSSLYVFACSRINWEEEAKKAVENAVVDQKIEHAIHDKFETLLGAEVPEEETNSTV